MLDVALIAVYFVYVSSGTRTPKHVMLGIFCQKTTKEDKIIQNQ